MSSAVVTGICSQPAGKYLDRYGAAKIMSLGLMITVASFLLLAWAPIQNVWFISVLYDITWLRNGTFLYAIDYGRFEQLTPAATASSYSSGRSK